MKPFNSFGAAAADIAARTIRERLSGVAHGRWDQPVVGIVAGSGFKSLSESLEIIGRVAFGEIPGLTATSVKGHEGSFVLGFLVGRPVVLVSGRLHLYEGHDPARVGFHVRILKALGTPVHLILGAAGAVNPELTDGSLLAVSDHLNLTARNPLVGFNEPDEERFPDMSNAYDLELRQLLARCAAELEIPLGEGVYAALPGPSYETPAEIRMLRTLGADVVGMSTALEVITARAVGLRTAAVVCITNPAAGLSSAELRHSDVVTAAQRAVPDALRLITAFTDRLDPAGTGETGRKPPGRCT